MLHMEDENGEQSNPYFVAENVRVRRRSPGGDLAILRLIASSSDPFRFGQMRKMAIDKRVGFAETVNSGKDGSREGKVKSGLVRRIYHADSHTGFSQATGTAC